MGQRKLNLSGISVCPTTMKAVALILALAVITGCNARAVIQTDVTPNRWEDTVNRFWQYVSDLNQQADGVVQNLKASQLTRELDTLISDTMAELTAYKDEIQTKVSPIADTSASKLSEDLQLLANKLQKDMLDAKEPKEGGGGKAKKKKWSMGKVRDKLNN